MAEEEKLIAFADDQLRSASTTSNLMEMKLFIPSIEGDTREEPCSGWSNGDPLDPFTDPVYWEKG